MKGRRDNFKAELMTILNRYSMENGSDTPDFILADYLIKCLDVFDVTMAHREEWYGRVLRGQPSVAPPGEAL
jgi:hypothetical protein